MPRFRLSVPEVWRRTVTVSASSQEDAIAEVLHDHGSVEQEPAVYSSTIGPEDAEWIVLDEVTGD